jgi:putative heme-binding domain-containing protein
VEELLALAKRDDADPQARRAALKSLLVNPRPDLLPLLREWASDKVLGLAAISGLAAFDDPTVAKALLTHYPRFSAESRTAAITTLVSRVSNARALVDGIAAGAVPRSDVTPFHARQIHNLGDAALTEKLTAAWGEVRDTPEAKKAEHARWKGVLTADALRNADAGKGRALFDQACAACHKLFGAGGAVGPELTDSDRGNLDYLLENILDPGATLPMDFRMTVFTLKDGRILTGITAAQTEKMITIQSQVERLDIEKSAITKQQVLHMPLMPEGMLGGLKEEQVRDLFAYLMSKQQVEPAR